MKRPKRKKRIAAIHREPPDRRWERCPWNDLRDELTLYISPQLKQRLGLNTKTTVEYLDRQTGRDR